jgi:hypothetical protein
VFTVNTDGTAFTVLRSFTLGSDGAAPYGGLISADNTLYGTRLLVAVRLHWENTGISFLHAKIPSVRQTLTLWWQAVPLSRGNTRLKLQDQAAQRPADAKPPPITVSQATATGCRNDMTGDGGHWPYDIRRLEGKISENFAINL